MIKIPANWYTIPGFTSYEINIHTKDIRSNKHFSKDPHHIMKVNNNKVRIVDDFGKPVRVDVNDIYNLTFNSGKKLKPRGDNDIYIGGMIKGLRNSVAEIIDDEEKYVTLDFCNIVNNETCRLIKPFTIDLSKN